MNKRKIAAYSLGPLGAGILSIISLPLITWIYPVEDVGRISMLQVVTSFCTLLFCFGLDQSYVREYHEYENKPKLLKLSITPGLFILTICCGLLLVINSRLIAQWLYDIPSTYLSITSVICLIASFISRFLSLILRMQEKALAYSMSQLLPKLLFLSFLIITLLLGFKKNIYNLIAAQTLSIVAIFIVLSWNTKREWGSSIKLQITWIELRPLLFYGIPLVIGGLSSWGLKVMDRLFLRSMSSFTELGIYSVTMSIAGAAVIFSNIFNTIWAPLVFKWIKEGADLNKVDEISSHLLAAIYFITVLSGLFSWLLPLFLPKDYTDSQHLITICILGPLFYTLSETTAIGISIVRKTNLLMIASFGAMIVNGAGNYLLVPKIGALGAAISTAIAFWSFYTFRTEFAHRVWRTFPRAKSYLVVTTLLLITVIDGVYLKGSSIAILIWIICLIIGIIFFNQSCKLLVSLLFNLKRSSSIRS